MHENIHVHKGIDTEQPECVWCRRDKNNIINSALTCYADRALSVLSIHIHLKDGTMIHFSSRKVTFMPFSAASV